MFTYYNFWKNSQLKREAIFGFFVPIVQYNIKRTINLRKKNKSLITLTWHVPPPKWPPFFVVTLLGDGRLRNRAWIDVKNANHAQRVDLKNEKSIFQSVIFHIWRKKWKMLLKELTAILNNATHAKPTCNREFQNPFKLFWKQICFASIADL